VYSEVMITVMEAWSWLWWRGPGRLTWPGA